MRLVWRTILLGAICGLIGASAPAPTRSFRKNTEAPTRALVSRNLTVANHARLPVTEMYVSPNDAPDWGDDRLAGSSVEPGKSFNVRLGRTRMCLFDVQLVYRDGSREEAHDYDVCHGNKIAFDGSTATDVPVGPTHDVTVVNNDTRPIQQMFLSEAEASQWGNDRITSRGLSVGDRIEIKFQGGCTVDLRVIFDNRGAEERRGLDICAKPALSIEPGWTTADSPPVPAPAAKPLALTSSSPPPAAEMGRTTLRVANNTGADITELYLYPEGRADQGRDLLGHAVLREATSELVTLVRGTVCRFSAHLVFAGRVADREVHGLDVCASPDVTLAH